MKKNESNQVVKDSIFEALMILMQTKEFNEINITDITKKAGVSRMGYYRNYDSKEDILKDKFTEIFDTCLETIEQTPDYTWEKLIVLACEYFYEYRALMQNLEKANLSELLLICSSDYMQKLNKRHYNGTTEDVDYYYYVSYQIGGFYNVVMDWVRGGYQQPPNKIAEIVNEVTIHPQQIRNQKK